MRPDIDRDGVMACLAASSWPSPYYYGGTLEGMAADERPDKYGEEILAYEREYEARTKADAVA